MPIYVTLFNWTDQGRKDVATVADRADTVKQRLEQAGCKLVGVYLTMGRYDQVAIVDAPNDEVMAKMAFMVAGRGYATSETLRCFTMDEARALLK